jgi:HSP20 family molecular chaperone IbpA
MVARQELQVQEKREVDKKQETTVPARFFLPNTDIYETEHALTLVMEMPGVRKDNVDVRVEDSTLAVEGRIDFGNYERLTPLYTEYNIGHYRRGFTLSSKIDQSSISARMEDGVLTLVLPKVEEAKPRRIEIG